MNVPDTPQTPSAPDDTCAGKLASVSWDFRNAHGRGGIHGIHPYPTKFTPHLPRELLRVFPPRDGLAVLDPFCGSGTTLVEANAAGFPAIGIDLNPLAVMIAKVKTTPLPEAIAPIARALAASARREVAEIPQVPRLDHWFLPSVQQSLANLVGQIAQIQETAVRDALKVALSSIVVRVSNQESDTRYAAVRKQVTGESVYEFFCRSAESLDGAILPMRRELSSSHAGSMLLCRNILEVQPEDIGTDVGLVITSPPYPNAYETWLYHKYRMYWLGMDPIAVRSAEIGARPLYHKGNPETEVDFEAKMSRVFWLLTRVMRPSSLACFVIGRSIIRGRTVDNAALLERAASRHGFRLLANAHRRIPTHRKSFNPAISTINSESILVFGLEDG